MWRPVDTQDYEQWSHDQASVCACVHKREFGVWLCVTQLINLSSRNTTEALCSRRGLEPGLLNAETSALTIRPPLLSLSKLMSGLIVHHLLLKHSEEQPKYWKHMHLLMGLFATVCLQMAKKIYRSILHQQQHNPCDSAPLIYINATSTGSWTSLF